jgi:hypothetical protein
VIEVAPPRKRKRAGSKIVEVAPEPRRRIPRTGVVVEVAPEISPERARGAIKEMAPLTRTKGDFARPIYEMAPQVRRKTREPHPEVAPEKKSES